MAGLLVVSMSPNLMRFLAAVAVAVDNDSVSFLCCCCCVCADGCVIAEPAADDVDDEWLTAAPVTALTVGGKGLGYILLPSFGVAGCAPTTTGTAFGVNPVVVVVTDLVCWWWLADGGGRLVERACAARECDWWCWVAMRLGLAAGCGGNGVVVVLVVATTTARRSVGCCCGCG